MSRLNRAHTPCCLIVSLYLFISDCEAAVLFVTATQEVVSFESALVVGVSCINQQKGIVFITGILCGLHRWIS